METRLASTIPQIGADWFPLERVKETRFGSRALA